jgi:LacI family transcriptional regulator
MPRTIKPPSLASVAREAGVSTASVSLVLGGRHRDYGISQSTAERVRAAAAAQGYQRTTRRRGPPRLHVVHFEDLVRMEERGLGGSVVHPLMDALAERDWMSSVVTRMPANPDQPGTEVLSASALVVPVNLGFDQAATRLIVAATAGGVQAVVLGRFIPELTAIQVDADQHAGGQMAAVHLLSLGHRRLAVVAGVAGDPHSEARCAGFLSACRVTGVEIDSWGHGGYTVKGGHRLVSERLAAGAHPQALFCCSDRMALGALLALREAGRSVPDEVSLMGFDDQVEFVEVAPGITSIRLVAEGVGMRLAALLDPTTPPQAARLILPPRLMVRGSTAVPRGHS